MELAALIEAASAPVRAWQDSFGAVPPHPSLRLSPVDAPDTADALARLGDRLADNYPFHHPRYAGQMLKPPHPVAVAAYTATMLLNPNNHALDGGPATAALEKECVAALAGMVGFGEHLGHLTSSGTIANLEALYVARALHPDRGVAYSADAHYTHARMCGVLGMDGQAVAVDAAGRMDLDALADLLRGGRVGTVVATLGTTGLGALDPLHEIVPLARAHGVRVHVDAAYGGFFALVADGAADGVAAAPYAALAGADSVVIDPHKHGLQPYGCGAVLFADPSVGRVYWHDSPYTYFTSAELHLGEISLECSRAGASAAALWATLQVLPLTAGGFGAVLRPGLRAARRWAGLLADSPVLAAYQPPELDIVTLLPRPTADGGYDLGDLDARSQAIFTGLMADPTDPVFLATYAVDGAALAARGHAVRRAGGAATGRPRILRSVLMKPEHEAYLDHLHARVSAAAR